jgi:hypothetical protein
MKWFVILLRKVLNLSSTLLEIEAAAKQKRNEVIRRVETADAFEKILDARHKKFMEHQKKFAQSSEEAES